MILRSATCLVWLLGCLLSVVGTRPMLARIPESAANLLPNPSFEETAPGGVRGWKSRAWHGEENGRWSVESPGRSGKQCLSIRSEKGTDAAWTTTVTVQPNTFYRLSGWIKTKDLRGAVGALLNIQNMQQVRTPRVTGTKDWTRVSTRVPDGRNDRAGNQLPVRRMGRIDRTGLVRRCRPGAGGRRVGTSSRRS